MPTTRSAASRAPDLATRRRQKHWALNPEEQRLRIETSRALANHIRGYRGDPRLSQADERFLASIDNLLREHEFKIEASPGQLEVVWKIIDKIDSPGSHMTRPGTCLGEDEDDPDE